VSNPIAHELVQTSLLGEALDPGPVAVFVADDDMRYLAVNAYACELLGYTREELLQLTVAQVAIAPEAGAEYEEMLSHGARTGVARLRRKDGSEFDLAYRASETTVGKMRLYVSVGWPAG
jgi:PAS domain S-box-containing protein